MLRKILVVALGVGFLGVAGCADVCEQAADAICDCDGAANNCGEDVDDAEAEGEKGECEGAAEKSAQCIVDNEEAMCKAFYEGELLSNPDNDYVQCITELAGG